MATKDFPLQPAPPYSITATLWEMGVTHKRDEWSHTDSCHALYYAGRHIGRYSAFQVSRLLEEHGLTSDSPSHMDAVIASNGGE